MRCTYSNHAKKMYRFHSPNRFGTVVKFVQNGDIPQVLVLWDGRTTTQRLHRDLISVVENKTDETLH